MQSLGKEDTSSDNLNPASKEQMTQLLVGWTPDTDLDFDLLNKVYQIKERKERK